jgi:hypothetical protein
MRLNLDWLVVDPIDYEYKEYLLLGYIKKVKEDFENFLIYPSFQEVSLHLANVSNFIERHQLLELTRDIEEEDDEILLSDLTQKQLKYHTNDEMIEILKIAKTAKEEFTNLFLIGKSLWSIVYDTISIFPTSNHENILIDKQNRGFFYFTYKKETIVYKYEVKNIPKSLKDTKCYLSLIYQGTRTDIDNILNDHLQGETNNFPLFSVTHNDYYPLHGTTLSMVRRKIMNYMLQTIKIFDLKEKDNRN